MDFSSLLLERSTLDIFPYVSVAGFNNNLLILSEVSFIISGAFALNSLPANILLFNS